MKIAGTFDTERLHLRPLGADDEALYCHLYMDPATMRHIGSPLSAEVALASFYKACGLAAQPAPAMQLWVIVEKESGVGVGLLARVRHGDVGDMAEMGIMLAAKGQGRGLALEALGTLTHRLFEQPGITRLWTSQSPGNAAVVRLMNRLGFERDDMGENASAIWRWRIDRASWQAGQSAPSTEV